MSEGLVAAATAFRITYLFSFPHGPAPRGISPEALRRLRSSTFADLQTELLVTFIRGVGGGPTSNTGFRGVQLLTSRFPDGTPYRMTIHPPYPADPVVRWFATAKLAALEYDDLARKLPGNTR